MEAPLMLTIIETAKRANVSEYAVRRWIREKKIVYVTSGKRFYVNWGSVVRFLSGCDNQNALKEA